MSKSHFGLIGLGVMGENLVLNAERNGFSSVVFNRTYSKTEEFLQGRGLGKNIEGAETLQEFVNKLERPRRILMMVKAGPATDAVIDNISGYLEEGDLLLDGLVCSIEINDFRFAKPLSEIGARNVISTNGASEFWLRNEKIYNINDVNLDDLEVTLIIDNKIMDSGNTKNVLNNPLNAALWLINNLAKKGETLLKGQFISSGSCTKPSKIYSGNHIKAKFEQLEDIEFQFI